MPVHETTKDGRPAMQWGKSGKKYPYRRGDKRSKARAKRRAERQGVAIRSTGWRE